MLRTGDVVYLDSSALVKMVIDEPESIALREYLGPLPVLASCTLARVEVARAVKLHGGAAIADVERFLQRTDLVELREDVLTRAADLTSASLRSLDAIHLEARPQTPFI